MNELRLIAQRVASLEEEARFRGTWPRAKDDDEYDLIRGERDAVKAQLARVRDEYDRRRSKADVGITIENLDAQVDAALAVFDQIEVITKDPGARADIPGVLEALNVHLWLNFGEGTRGKRAIRVLKGRLDHDGRGTAADALVRTRRRPRGCGVARGRHVAPRSRRKQNAVRSNPKVIGTAFR